MMYQVEVNIIGTTTVLVEADDPVSALQVAEQCVSPIQGEDWSYYAEQVSQVNVISEYTATHYECDPLD